MLKVIGKEIYAGNTRMNRNTRWKQDHSTYADLIISYLSQLGIDTIFGVPGGAIEPFMNSLAKSERQGGPSLVVARHECGAAFMADGYFRETGKMGVVCSTTGPGATNLVTGVASAFADEIPMLVITAQTPLPKFGKRALQESSCTAVNTVGIFHHITRFSTLVSHHEQLESKLVSAIMAAYRAPHGPAHISIPSDVLRVPAVIKPHIHSDLLVQDFSVADESLIERLCEKVARVDSVVVYIGSGVGKANKWVMKFVELVGAAFVTGPTGKAWVDETHPLFRGVYGFAGHQTAKDLFANDDVDLIIAVGTALGELGTSGWASQLLNTRLVHIDSTNEHFTRSTMANLHVYGDLNTIFRQLLERLSEAKNGGCTWLTIPNSSGVTNPLDGVPSLKEPEKCLSRDAPIKPQRLMTHLAETLPDETRIFIDAGNAWAWATHYFNRKNSQGMYRIAMSFGSMAWSIGASVGSAVGNPKAPTLCIVGDGSYLMGAQEITVAAQHRLPIVFLVLNDAAMGMVMHGQKLGEQESIGWQLNRVNYALLASAMGVEGQVIRTPLELKSIDWNAIFSEGAPFMLDVRIDRDEVPPMGERIKGLAVDISSTPGG